MTESEFKNFFEKVLKASHKFHDLKTEFDKKVESWYGFHYSDFNLDYIIDSIDYGVGTLTFEKFDKIMREQQSKLEKH